MNKDKIVEKTKKEYILDASKFTLGRLCSEAAAILNGKKSTSFAKNKVEDISLKIIKANSVRLTGNKLKTSLHKRYSGYPGGQKVKTLNIIKEQKGYREIIKHAINGMLPKNKLQTKRLLNLSIED